MTTPAASKQKYGKRLYGIVADGKIVDLPAYSTIKRQLYSFALERWKLEKVARNVAMSTALQMEAADPGRLRQATRKALEGDTESADIGTQVHRYCELDDLGQLEDEFLPPVAKPWLEHYRHARDRFGWETIEQEATVYNLRFQYAGTADKFARFPGLPYILASDPYNLPLLDMDDDVFVVDIKTGKGVYNDMALQLWAYANGEGIFEPANQNDFPEYMTKTEVLQQQIESGKGYDLIGGRRTKYKSWSDAAIREARGLLETEWLDLYAEKSTTRPMPERLRKDVGLIIHLHADSCDVVPVWIGGDGLGSPGLAVAGLSALYRFGERRDIVHTPINPGDTSNDNRSTSSNGSESASSGLGVPAGTPGSRPAGPVDGRSEGRVEDSRGGAPGGSGSVPASDPGPGAGRLAAVTEAAAATEAAAIERIKTAFPGTEEIDQLDAPITETQRLMCVEWLKDIRDNRPQLLGPLKEALEANGVHKSIMKDTGWLQRELNDWRRVVASVDSPQQH